MNSSLIIFLLFTILFSSANVYAELLIELDKEIASSIDDPVFITVKLDYIPQDNFVLFQIFDSMGNIVNENYIPVDQNGYLCGFVIRDAERNIFPNCVLDFVGRSNSPLAGGIYEIEVIGRSNNEIVIDSNFFTLHIIQQSQNSSEITDTQNGGGCLQRCGPRGRLDLPGHGAPRAEHVGRHQRRSRYRDDPRYAVAGRHQRHAL